MSLILCLFSLTQLTLKTMKGANGHNRESLVGRKQREQKLVENSISKSLKVGFSVMTSCLCSSLETLHSPNQILFGTKTNDSAAHHHSPRLTLLCLLYAFSHLYSLLPHRSIRLTLSTSHLSTPCSLSTHRVCCREAEAERGCEAIAHSHSSLRITSLSTPQTHSTPRSSLRHASRFSQVEAWHS